MGGFGDVIQATSIPLWEDIVAVLQWGKQAWGGNVNGQSTELECTPMFPNSLLIPWFWKSFWHFLPMKQDVDPTPSAPSPCWRRNTSKNMKYISSEDVPEVKSNHPATPALLGNSRNLNQKWIFTAKLKTSLKKKTPKPVCCKKSWEGCSISSCRRGSGLLPTHALLVCKALVWRWGHPFYSSDSHLFGADAKCKTIPDSNEKKPSFLGQTLI